MDNNEIEKERVAKQRSLARFSTPSIGWSIARLLLLSATVLLLLMLYWSSSLVEKDLKSLQQDILQIKNELQELTLNGGAPYQAEPNRRSPSPHVDPSLPNLLTEDEFYTTNLPKALGAEFHPVGTNHLATIGKPEHLHPFSPWAEVSSWISLCSVSLGQEHFGIYESFAPAFAEKMELRTSREGEPEYWLHLRDDLFWAPLNPAHFPASVKLAPQFQKRQPVTAHDVKFFFDAIMNPLVQEGSAIALRLEFQDIAEMRVVDDRTLVVRWNTKELTNDEGEVVRKQKYQAKLLTLSLRPLASFVYQYFADGSKILSDDSDPSAYRTSAIWAQNFSHHWAKNAIVSCGAWTFDGMTDRGIFFKRNPRFYSAYDALMAQKEFVFKNSFDGIWESFKAGQIDYFAMPPYQLSELELFLKSEPYKKQEAAGRGISRLDYYSRSYSYIGWNQAKPLFKSKNVRQALTMAIDRQRIIKQNLSGMGSAITGPFFIYSPSYDKSIIPIPYNPQRARKMLEEEGWVDHDGDGIIDKEIEGKRVPFQFDLTYYVKNSASKDICEYIATALKAVGIACNLHGVDTADLSAEIDNKSFDALFLAWVLGTPPEDPKQLWYSKVAAETGSSNFIGFSNHEADEIIEKLEFEDDPKKRLALYHRFHKIIYDEQPYTFLYTPKVSFIYRSYVQNVFLPVDRQDMIPGANVAEPQPGIFWLKEPTP